MHCHAPRPSNPRTLTLTPHPLPRARAQAEAWSHAKAVGIFQKQPSATIVNSGETMYPAGRSQVRTHNISLDIMCRRQLLFCSGLHRAWTYPQRPHLPSGACGHHLTPPPAPSRPQAVTQNGQQRGAVRSSGGFAAGNPVTLFGITSMASTDLGARAFAGE